ncbi:PH domain-containing protein [Williamsia sp.]|uniref:PH domain-containing protein n=1 Tax=Williamsia sp. TaxID=1872085 RepID=UPI001A3100CD|nr:PH domain-containing protein [Williamsia sp.]MBJ7288217.1 PH domain-containing protein [Williamsia sp.]
MGYPENILADGEHVVLHRHPHWKCLVLPTIVFLLVTAAAGVAGGYTTSSSLSGTGELVVWVVIAAVWLALVVWFFLRPLISWRTTHFVLTDRRVTFRNGILTRSGIDIPLQRINSVEFRHGLVDRMLRTGTLIIESASDDPLSFDDIPQVEKVHSLLYHEVFDRGDGNVNT